VLIFLTIVLTLANSMFASLDYHYFLNIGIILINVTYAVFNLVMIRHNHPEFAWYWPINLWGIVWACIGLWRGPQ
jgi:hypothetical protein